jgi:hypothetical protein
MKILITHHGDIHGNLMIMKFISILHQKEVDYKVIGFKQGISNKPSDSKYSIENISLNENDPMNIFRYALRFLKLTFRLRTEIRLYEPDIIHSISYISFFVSKVAAFGYRVGFVYEAYELESQQDGYSAIKSLFIKYIERILLTRKDLLIVPNKSISVWYANNKIDSNKIEVIRSNVPLIREIRQELNNDYFREIYNIPLDSKIFILVGIVSEGRNVNLLIDIFNDEEVKSHLILMGLEINDNISSKINESKKIHYHDFVDKQIMIDYIKHADFGLCLIEPTCLSYELSLPQKFWEYVYAELPILATRLPEMEYYINKYNLGIVVNNDINDIKNTIIFLQSSSEVITANIDLESYNYENNFYKYINIYRKIINQTS